MSSTLSICVQIFILPCLVPAAPIQNIDLNAAAREIEGLSRNSQAFLNYIYFYTIITTITGVAAVALFCGLLILTMRLICFTLKTIYAPCNT